MLLQDPSRDCTPELPPLLRAAEEAASPLRSAPRITGPRGTQPARLYARGCARVSRLQHSPGPPRSTRRLEVRHACGGVWLPGKTSLEFRGGRDCDAGAHASITSGIRTRPSLVRRPGTPPTPPLGPQGGRRARTVAPRFSVRRPAPPPNPPRRRAPGPPLPQRRALLPIGRSDPRKGRGHSPRRAHALSASRLRVGPRDAHPRVPQ
ncbi:hypothetical protein ACRRTK_001541 [Alexandromys fortis]